MATLLLNLAQDAKSNFVKLFTLQHDSVSILDEDGEEKVVKAPVVRPDNPFRTLQMIERTHWLCFFCGFFAIFADFLDFYLLVIQSKKLAVYFDTTKTNISSSITYTLLLRPVGAIIFGTMGDYMGRKYPMVLNCILLGVFQIATIFCYNLKTFLAVRSLFGLFFGGLWGVAAAMAMERCPAPARGLMSGIFQAAAPFGYMMAAAMNLGVGAGTETWKLTFWISAAISFTAALLRLMIPESPQFTTKSSMIESLEEHTRNTPKGWARVHAFVHDFKAMLKKDWKRFIYMVLLISSIIYLSHAIVDSYITFLLVVKKLSNRDASEVGILTRISGCSGSIIVGWLSQSVGRRRVIVVCAVMVLIAIPAYLLPLGYSGLAAGGAFMMFFLDGIGGLTAIHLNELAPASFRAVMAGTSNQLGAMISAPSAQIVNTFAEANFVTVDGTRVEAYGPVMMIFIAICGVAVIILAAIGPECRGTHFEAATAAGMATFSPKNSCGKGLNSAMQDKEGDILVSKGNNQDTQSNKSTATSK